jgi:hypothetical protein
MKTPKMNIMSKKNKKQNDELIERIKEIQSQLNDVKSDAGIVVEEGDIVFTRQQLEDFLVEYTNKINQYIFDEAFSNIDSDEVVSFDVDGREINTYVDEDKLRDTFIEATESVESNIIMEYADEAMAEVGVI